MDPKTSSIILNQKYLVKYKNYNVEIHEIFPKGKTNEFIKFKTETLISNIKFNPLVENIIIISFFNGTCKIYNILNKNKKEDIFFECIQEESIAYSYFNIFDPNKVASLSDDNNIFIWDVRYHNQKKIDSCDTIYSMKWSYYGSKYLEIINTSNEVRLVNVDTKINEVTIKLEVIPINFFFCQKIVLF
jgi:WD40 repeat protein